MYEFEGAESYTELIAGYEDHLAPDEQRMHMVFPENLGKDVTGGIVIASLDYLGNDRVGNIAIDTLTVNDLDTEALAEAAQAHGYRFKETGKEYRVDKTYSLFGKHFTIPFGTPAMWSSKKIDEGRSMLSVFRSEDTSAIMDSYLEIIAGREG